jgi:hypothetical protein
MKQIAIKRYEEELFFKTYFVYLCVTLWLKKGGCNEDPSARGAYMLRRLVSVGFHSSQDEGAAS